MVEPASGLLLSCDKVNRRVLALKSSLCYNVHVSGESNLGSMYVIQGDDTDMTVLFSYVVSEPYSMDLNWRYCVVDIHIFVNGPSYMLSQLPEILEEWLTYRD